VKIYHDEDMQRFYIPVHPNWEVQTQGKGSSFRIANCETGDRWLVTDKHLHIMLEEMARDINEAAFAPPKSEWVSVSDRLPPRDTPVLILHSEEVKVGELRWDSPGFEDTYEEFWYWDSPTDDGQEWERPDVTHWQAIPLPPEQTK